MYVRDLSRAQLIELKERYLTNALLELENRTPSYGELADADNIVDDQIIFDAYAGTMFSADDFFCTVE